MNAPKPDLSAALLAHLSSPADLADQRARALAGIAAEQQSMKLRRIVTQVFWVGCAALSVLYFWFTAGISPAARAPFLAGFFLFWGAFEVVKHRIHAARLDVLREVKLLQLQILELKAADEGSPSTTNRSTAP